MELQVRYRQQPVNPSGDVRTTSAQRQGGRPQWLHRETPHLPPSVPPAINSQETNTRGQGRGRGAGRVRGYSPRGRSGRWCAVKLAAVTAEAPRHCNAKPSCEQRVDNAIPWEEGADEAKYECDFPPLPSYKQWMAGMKTRKCAVPLIWPKCAKPSSMCPAIVLSGM